MILRSPFKDSLDINCLKRISGIDAGSRRDRATALRCSVAHVLRSRSEK
jgi:hypothetical protein